MRLSSGFDNLASLSPHALILGDHTSCSPISNELELGLSFADAYPWVRLSYPCLTKLGRFWLTKLTRIESLLTGMLHRDRSPAYLISAEGMRSNYI